MSLYNMLFGVNPWAGLCLQALGINSSDVPRFRDAFIDEESGDIVLYTRTGGGNRQVWENAESYKDFFEDEDDPQGPWNEDLRKLPGYKRDLDDGFDTTYAYFYFEPRPEWKPILAAVAQVKSSTNPREKWEHLMADLKNNKDFPATAEGQRALAVGQKILDQMDAILSR